MLGSGNGGMRERGKGGTVHRSIVPSFRSLLRQIAGMPDYAAHIEHLRHSHPGRPFPTEREFYEEFVRNRYEDGPTRCC
jgi:uncharacterized short protein YbdD (DUF466 family)